MFKEKAAPKTDEQIEAALDQDMRKQWRNSHWYQAGTMATDRRQPDPEQSRPQALRFGTYLYPGLGTSGNRVGMVHRLRFDPYRHMHRLPWWYPPRDRMPP